MRQLCGGWDAFLWNGALLAPASSIPRPGPSERRWSCEKLKVLHSTPFLTIWISLWSDGITALSHFFEKKDSWDGFVCPKHCSILSIFFPKKIISIHIIKGKMIKLTITVKFNKNLTRQKKINEAKNDQVKKKHNWYYWLIDRLIYHFQRSHINQSINRSILINQSIDPY